MNSKKLISVVLSALLLMSSILCVSAEKAAADVQVAVETFNVKVTVTTEAATGRMTAILRNKANNLWIDMDQTDAYEAVDGKNVYTFDLVMQPQLDTGVYTVTVGGNVAETAKDFNFTNIGLVVDFYNTLDGAEASEIYALLTSEDNVLPYDFSAYKKLSTDIRALVDAEIAAWDMETTLQGDYVYDEEGNVVEDESVNSVADSNKEFVEAMDAIMANAQIADVNTATSTWAELVKAAEMDAKFMEDENKNTVHTYYVANAPKSLETADIQKALDEAQLLAVAKEQGSTALKEAFDYYVDKEVVQMDEATQKAYDDICAAGKADAFFAEMKKLDNSSVEKMLTNVPAAAENAENAASGSVNGGNGNTGGTTGGVGGGNGNYGGGAYGGGGMGGTGSNLGGNHRLPGTTTMDGDAADTVVKEEAPVYDASFSDLGEATWAASSIRGLAEKGIISGRGDGKFYPNDIVTREEFVKIIVTAFDALDEKATASFADVAEDRWSYKYIATANRLGLVTGEDDSTFNPTGIITREDMAVIMHRAMNLASLEDGTYTLDFTDADEIAPYAVDAVNQLAGKKIINGMGDGTFAPKGTVTRAQAAKVVYELLALIGGVN